MLSDEVLECLICLTAVGVLIGPVKAVVVAIAFPTLVYAVLVLTAELALVALLNHWFNARGKLSKSRYEVPFLGSR